MKSNIDSEGHLVNVTCKRLRKDDIDVNEIIKDDKNYEQVALLLILLLTCFIFQFNIKDINYYHY